jgi:NADPH-dependent glutamate synthase beta subunit-like oxidoreductase
VEVCPTGALLDKSGSKPVRSGDHPPCLKACPAGIDIPEYLKRVAEGDNDSALKAIWNSVPFPGILGYVCFHPCEAECKRGVIDNSLAICAIKRFAYENANVDPIINLIPKVATGKKIAIIGSGPAGLTSAFYLRLAGHYLDVFEAEEKLGGMLRYGIPQYRLPEEVLDDELQNLNNLGINFHLKKRLGSNFNLSDLIVDQYDAVLLTIGANLSINLQLPGGDLPQIYMALDFLSSVKRGNPPPLQGRVVIIGGGNVAVDSAMSARRLGCSEVIMICLEGREEMPAHSWEIKQALEEGITIIPGWGPQEFQAKEGKLYEIIFQQCIKVFDENGKFRPQYQEDNTFTQKTDYAIIAIGQIPDKSLIADFQKLEHRPPLFVAGDASKGPTSVIDAIADGKKIAMEIDKMLGGTGLCDFWPYRKRSDDPVLGKDKNFYQHPVQKPVQTNPVLRIKSFEIIEATFPPEVAREEAYRCLRCNLRTLISPVVLPPDRWQVLTSETIDAVASSEGVYQLADANRKVLKIAGVANLRSALEAELKKQDAGVHFCWELNKMYSQRESELLQNYIKEFGGMPGGGKDDLDDLF